MTSITGGGASGSSDQDLNTIDSVEFKSVTNEWTDYYEIMTPASPSAGKDRVYAKSDNNLYLLTAAGVESRISGGGLTTAWDFNTTLTMVDPGAGNIRFDNATSALTTVAILG